MNQNQDGEQDPLLSLLPGGAKRFVGDWEVQAVLGQGAFGKAYLVNKYLKVGAEEVTTSAVMKIVKTTAMANTGAKSMLVNEIKQLSLVNSRYVANLRDAGLYNNGFSDAPFLVVDFIEGGNLRNLIRERRSKGQAGLSASQFKTLVENTLRGLYSAHKENVLHLDIKPDNIIYSQSDDAFVFIDFGLAVLSHRDTINTFIGGTHGYIAPEEYISETSRMSDIFSLGMTFYEAAIGSNPIQRALAEYLIQNDPNRSNVPRAAQIATETTAINFDQLSPDKRALIEPMLRHDPKQRPSLARLISLASELSTGSSSDGIVISDEDTVLTTELLEEVIRLVSKQPIDNIKLTVDHPDYFQVWLKTKRVDGEIVMICSKPKDYLALGDLGWRPHLPGTLILKLADKPAYELVAGIALRAITYGFGITKNFSIT
jgi:serine/threonine protein kinase